jgi:hypothetical protein
LPDTQGTLRTPSVAARWEKLSGFASLPGFACPLATINYFLVQPPASVLQQLGFAKNVLREVGNPKNSRHGLAKLLVIGKVDL